MVVTETESGQQEIATLPPRGRILLLTSSFPRWQDDSTTPFILHLAQDLQDLGWQVDVLAPHAPGAAKKEMIGGVNVERFRYFWPASQETVCYQGGALVNLRKAKSNYLKLPALIFFEWLAVAWRLLARKYDLVHSHWILPQGFVGVLAARPFGVRHVVTIHGSDIFGLKGRPLQAFKGFALNHADQITVNSSATEHATQAINHNQTPVTRIPMGVSEPEPDLDSVANLRGTYRRGDGPLLLFVGRLIEEKGVDDFIAATTLLKQKLPNVTALIVGDGQDRARFEQQGADLRSEERLHFCGWVPPEQISCYLAAADIFIGPSKTSPEGGVEAQGLTFAEALMVGTPVIATRSGGIADTIRHEETGLLVNENSPEEIAAAVVRIAGDRELADRLRKNGLQFSSGRLSRHVSAQSFSQLFQRSIGGGI